MGWARGTRIFDAMVPELLEGAGSVEDFEQMLETLIEALEDCDWDTQNDSTYFDTPGVQKIFRKRNPEWFEDEDEED